MTVKWEILLLARLGCIVVLYGFLSACEDPTLVAISTGVDPEYYYSDERVCDVNMKRLDGFVIPYVYSSEVRGFRMVACLISRQSKVPREPCKKWLLRRMSMQKETELSAGLRMQETDRSDAAKWLVAYLDAGSEVDFKKENPPPHTYRNPHGIPHWIKVIRRNLGDEAARPHIEKEMREEALRRSRIRKEWKARIKEAWWKAIPSKHYSRDAKEIATLQQGIVAIELGLCPYCCIRFGVTYVSGDQVKRFIEHLKRDPLVWYAGYGEFVLDGEGRILRSGRRFHFDTNRTH